MNQKTKNNFFALVLLAFGVNTVINAAPGTGVIIPLYPKNNNGNNNHGENDGNYNHPKSPATDVLPIVTYDDETSILAFEATLGMVFTYEVVDASNSVVATGIVSLASGQTDILSLSSLSAGSYTLLIYIGEQAYEGIFEK